MASTMEVAEPRVPQSWLQRARAEVDQRQVQLLQATVAKDCSPAELDMFLELAARYALDPFAGQIYAAKMGGRDGGSGRIAIITSRDGFLSIANRYDDFLGIEGDVVRLGDEFSKRQTPEGPVIEHSYGAERGTIVGAWALCHRQGRKPTYFYAPYDEYEPKSQKKREHSPWGAQASAMILKCAESMVLRKAFSITGLVGEEEMARRMSAEALTNGQSGAVEPPYGDDEEGELLRGLVDAANRLQPGSYRDAKVNALLAAQPREEVVVEVREFVLANGGAITEEGVIVT